MQQDIPEDLLPLDLSEFKLPSPNDLSEDDRVALMRNAASRICDGAEDLEFSASTSGGHAAVDMWMLLIVRMVTRVAVPPGSETPNEEAESSNAGESRLTAFYSRQDALRQTLCEYILADFPARFVNVVLLCKRGYSVMPGCAWPLRG